MINLAKRRNNFRQFVVLLLAMIALLSLSGCSLFCRPCPEEVLECCEDFAAVGFSSGLPLTKIPMWIVMTRALLLAWMIYALLFFQGKNSTSSYAGPISIS